jgi:hypothetical protein
LPVNDASNAQNWFAKEAARRGWLLSRTHNSWTHLNVADADVRDFLVNMVTDVNANYAANAAFGGVQLDDHFGVHVSLGVDATRSLSDMVRRISAAVTPARLSLAPNIMPHSLRDYQLDWPSLSQYAFEIVPQTYTSSAAAFRSAKMADQYPYVARTKYVAGVRCNGEPATAWAEVASMVSSARDAGLKGVSIWHAGCMSSLYTASAVAAWTPTTTTTTTTSSGRACSGVGVAKGSCTPAAQCADGGLVGVQSSSCSGGTVCCARLVCRAPAGRPTASRTMCAEDAVCAKYGGVSYSTVRPNYVTACSGLVSSTQRCCAFPDSANLPRSGSAFLEDEEGGNGDQVSGSSAASISALTLPLVVVVIGLAVHD